jgi:hypothetical protein
MRHYYVTLCRALVSAGFSHKPIQFPPMLEPNVQILWAAVCCITLAVDGCSDSLKNIQ